MNFERPKTSFEKVVGSISEAEKEKILREKAEIFDSQAFEELKDKEREKTREELQIISLANEATNELRKKYGLADFDIPAKNIHIIKEEKWPETGKSAVYKPEFQAIGIRESSTREGNSKMQFLDIMVHEMIHFKSYQALQVTKSDDPKLRDYRSGLIVYTRDGERGYFTGLDEAVTEEITKKLAAKLFSRPLFKKELEQTQKIILKYPRAVNLEGEPLFDDDTYYAEAETKGAWKDAAGRIFGLAESKKKILTNKFVYKEEREILNVLINKIFEKNKDKFKDREEVFEVFAKGLMTGNILPMARLIEATFGRGALKKITKRDAKAQADSF